jgi:hypothetical protein
MRCIQSFGGETLQKESLGKPRPRWKNNSKTGVQEVESGRGLGDLTQVRDKWRAVVNTVMNFRGQRNAGNFLTS